MPGKILFLNEHITMDSLCNRNDRVHWMRHIVASTRRG